MEPTRRFRIVVAYLGGPFRGWQRQDNAPSVQAEIERALANVFDGLTVTVEGSGRTDAGVHATGQVAHVDLPATIPATSLLKAVNHHLPETISVLSASGVAQSFHSRKHSRGKRYVYRARWDGAPVLPPWQTLRTADLRPPKDPQALLDLVSLFEGHRDWAPFTVANPVTRTTVRTVYSATAVAGRHGIRFEFIGGGFLRYQIRRMVGALMQVGWEQFDLEWLQSHLASSRHPSDIYTAPARGLTLEQVYFRTPKVADRETTAD